MVVHTAPVNLEDAGRLSAILHTLTDAIRAITKAIDPFLPNTARRLDQRFKFGLFARPEWPNSLNADRDNGAKALDPLGTERLFPKTAKSSLV